MSFVIRFVWPSSVFRYVVLGSILFTIIPAVLFSLVEGWAFLDSWYFTIISLTTIGFGDYAPSYITERGFLSIYRVMAICWLLIGLAWLGGLLSLMSSLFGEIHSNIMVGPVRMKSFYEQRNVHSKEKMKSIKKASRTVTNNRQKQLDREERIKQRHGQKKVKYMYNIEL